MKVKLKEMQEISAPYTMFFSVVCEQWDHEQQLLRQLRSVNVTFSVLVLLCFVVGLINLSQGNPSEQSSTKNGHSSSLAFDGILNQTSSYCSLTHRDENPWILVDLKKNVYVHHIKIYGRSDLPSDQLANGSIFILKSKGNPREELCVAIDGLSSKEKSETFHCTKPLKGRFVKLVLNGLIVLKICEFQVFGYYWIYPKNSNEPLIRRYIICL